MSNNIQQQIDKKVKELEILRRKLDENKSDWLYIKELKIEVEIEVHDKGKSWDELGLKDREEELLTAEQCLWLANSKYASKLKMDGSSTKDDFFIKQPLNLNRKNGYVARFCSDSDCSDLDCDGNSSYSSSALGVRFVRKKSK